MAERLRQNIWLLVIPVLLMATALAAQRLADYPFDNDERYSVRLAGGVEDGPYSLAEVWSAVTEQYPDQAYGLPLVNSIWGQIFGWSEFSLRLVPLFAGILAIAWTYRAGSDWFAPLAGWIATILLSVSMLFVIYLHVIRPYTLVALFTMMATWGYWRMTLSNRNPGKNRIGTLSFLLGCIGIIYSNYYAIMLLVVLVFWHLLFMPKNRQWWGPVFLLGLAGLSFIPEVGGFLAGINETQTRPGHTDPVAMIRAAEILPGLVLIFSNSVLDLPSIRYGFAPNVVGLAILAVLVAYGFWRYRQRAWIQQIQYPLFITVSLLLLMLLMNEILLIFRDDRFRYLIAMWPLLSILIGWGIWRTRARWRWVAGSVTGVFILYSLWANLATELRYDFYPLQIRNPLLDYMRVVEKNSWQQDLLLIEEQLHRLTLPKVESFPAHYENVLVFSNSLRTQAEFENALKDELRIWTLAGQTDGAEHRAMISALPAELSLCKRFIQRSNLSLELYTWSPVHCPNEAAPVMRFGDAVMLDNSAVTVVSGDALQVDLLLRSEEVTGMTAYSVALHVFDVSSGEKVAQGDQGLWLGRYNPVRSEIDISALAAGEYEVKIGLYNWQTLAHLSGMDLSLGQTADFLTLSQFRVE